MLIKFLWFGDNAIKSFEKVAIVWKHYCKYDVVVIVAIKKLARMSLWKIMVLLSSENSDK